MKISLNTVHRNLRILLLSMGLLSPQAVWAHGGFGGGMPHIAHNASVSRGFGGSRSLGSVVPSSSQSSFSGVGGSIGGVNKGISGVSGSNVAKLSPNSAISASKFVNQPAKLAGASGGNSLPGSAVGKFPTKPIGLQPPQGTGTTPSGGSSGGAGSTPSAPGSGGPVSGGGPVFGGGGPCGGGPCGFGPGLSGFALGTLFGSLGGYGLGGSGYYGGGSGYYGGGNGGYGGGYASPVGYADNGSPNAAYGGVANSPSTPLVDPGVQPVSATSPAIASSIDLVLEDVTLAQPATLAAGPAYRVQFRNQGSQAAGKFVVGILALIDDTAPNDAPRALVEAPGLAAGEVGTVTLRLPQAATRLVNVSHTTPTMFTKLAVAVDVDNRVSETDKSNNGVVIDRTSLESAVK